MQRIGLRTTVVLLLLGQATAHAQGIDIDTGEFDIGDGDSYEWAIARGNSLIRMTGGELSGITEVFIDGVPIGNATAVALDEATFLFGGGQVAALCVSGGTSQFVMSGGVTNSFYAGGQSSFTMTGGVVEGNGYTDGSALFTMRGGRIERNMTGDGLSFIDAAGTNIFGGLQLLEGATAEVDDCFLGGIVSLYGLSAAIISKSEVSRTVGVHEDCVLALVDCHVGGDVRTHHQGVLTVSGSRLDEGCSGESSGTVDLDTSLVMGGIGQGDSGIFTLHSGTIVGGAGSTGEGSLHVLAGTIVGRINTWNNSVFTMAGGQAWSGATVNDASHLELSGGAIDGGVFCRETGTFVGTSGQIGSEVIAADFATLEFTADEFYWDHDHNPDTPKERLAFGTSTERQILPGDDIWIPDDQYFVLYGLEPHWEDGGVTQFDIRAKGDSWGDTWVGAITLRLVDCAGDMDGNGVLDSRDVLAFLNAWANGDDTADFNGDGTIDILDVLEFLNAWSGGC